MTGAVVSGFPMLCMYTLKDDYGQCFKMELEKKSWMFLTNTTSGRHDASSAAINGSLFVAGGRIRIKTHDLHIPVHYNESTIVQILSSGSQNFTGSTEPVELVLMKSMFWESTPSL